MHCVLRVAPQVAHAWHGVEGDAPPRVGRAVAVVAVPVAAVRVVLVAFRRICIAPAKLVLVASAQIQIVRPLAPARMARAVADEDKQPADDAAAIRVGPHALVG